jgi:hypothetical protein
VRADEDDDDDADDDDGRSAAPDTPRLNARIARRAAANMFAELVAGFTACCSTRLNEPPRALCSATSGGGVAHRGQQSALQALQSAVRVRIWETSRPPLPRCRSDVVGL